MSTWIVDHFQALRGPAMASVTLPGFDQAGKEFLALFAYGGDNNVYETGNSGRMVRARDWTLLGAGEAWRIMEHSVLVSSDCEGGCIRINGSQRSLPENFIGRCRGALDRALSCDEMERGFRDRPGMDVSVRIVDGVPDMDAATYAALRAWREPKVYEKEVTWYLSPFHDAEDAAVVAHLVPFGYRYVRARVSGTPENLRWCKSDVRQIVRRRRRA